VETSRSKQKGGFFLGIGVRRLQGGGLQEDQEEEGVRNYRDI
jgi:hypothetical protein